MVVTTKGSVQDDVDMNQAKSRWKKRKKLKNKKRVPDDVISTLS
jgi:hypothetical protein